MDRKTLKQNAWNAVKGNRRPFNLAILLYLAAVLILAIPYCLVLLRISEDLGETSGFIGLFLIVYVIFMAFLIVVPPMLTMAYVKTLKDLDTQIADPAAPKISFKDYLNNLKKSGCGIGNFWWTYLWLVLWSMLCLIPFAILTSIVIAGAERAGQDVELIIFIPIVILYILLIGVLINRSIAYSLNWFILAEDSRIGTVEATKDSKIITKGHKWELFVLDLTFIGWYLLTILTCGLLAFWILPYYGMTKFNAFKYLVDEYNKKASEPMNFTPKYVKEYAQENPYFADDLHKTLEPNAQSDQESQSKPESEE